MGMPLFQKDKMSAEERAQALMEGKPMDRIPFSILAFAFHGVNVGYTINEWYSDMEKACSAGLRHVTHMWSAMSTIRREKAYRYSGVIESTLEMDALTTEIIADGKHYPPELVRLAYKCKGKEKLCLISDTMRAAGMPEGNYTVSGLEVIVEDGVAFTKDRNAFACSIRPVGFMVPFVHRQLGFDLQAAIEMATLTPARIIGVYNTKGALNSGMDADINCLDQTNLEIRYEIKSGNEKAHKHKQHMLENEMRFF